MGLRGAINEDDGNYIKNGAQMKSDEQVFGSNTSCGETK